MPSASITRRTTKRGEPRFVVRYRLGGAAYPLVHGGSFVTMRDARTRLGLVTGELAAGRNPGDALRALSVAPAALRTFEQVAVEYEASRVDVASTTARTLATYLRAVVPTFEGRDPHTITVADVQAWVNAATVKPSSLRLYLAALRAVLDYAGVDPNPARDSRVKMPKQQRDTVTPPSAAEVDTIIANVPARWRLPLRVLEQTGLRVGELAALEWGDVDEKQSRFRIKHGKTASARRWAAVPAWLMEQVAATVAREDRTPERRVFHGFNAHGCGTAMGRACKTAGIPHYHPHDLRHRYASVKIAEGVPVTTLAAQLGHAKTSMTHDVYSHVLLDD